MQLSVQETRIAMMGNDRRNTRVIIIVEIFLVLTCFRRS